MTTADELRLASRPTGKGLLRTELSVPTMHCAGCMQRVETTLSRLAGVEYARVNLSTRRVAIHWRAADAPPPILETLHGIGYDGHLLDEAPARENRELRRLLIALAVAGFCTMNIMLFSVSVWAGADPQTRDLFHAISALLAVPALLFSGRIFFVSAWNAVRRGHTNMDVPISVGVILAFGLSLYDTLHHGHQVFFDASVALLFFLLAGRTLDYVMRDRARVAVTSLAKLAARGANIVTADGRVVYLPIADIEPGMRLRLAAGDRVPVDGVVEEGASELDCSIATGESVPVPVMPGSAVRAGTLNLTGPLTLTATAASADSFLAEMVRLMEAAEGGRARYRRLADRVAGLYAPVVHLTALATFIGWMLAGGDWHFATTTAIAVLIITCPCALGLAVPIVQVIAARRLFEHGVTVKDGAAMERLEQVDTVAFDKTGTLTEGAPRLVNPASIESAHLELAATIAAGSRHPLARALAALGGAPGGPDFVSIKEVPGNGIEARTAAACYRLGRAGWALAEQPEAGSEGSGTVLARDGVLLARFVFEDRLRQGAPAAIAALRRRGLALRLLSGDHREAVRPLASRLGLEDWEAEMAPGAKVERINALRAAGHRVMMVGDGLNDAPALAAANVSMAPGEAADVGRNAADFVFLRRDLGAVPHALEIAARSGRLIRQNIGLAIAYNLVAVPVAISGNVTPLVAALAMSFSSIVVVANAMRLSGERTVEPAGWRQDAALGPAE
jgi:Cu2+-exporting ATPase